MTTAIGLESLVQRGRSAFFIELTSLYQESFKALRSLPKPTQEQVFLLLKKIGFDSAVQALVEKHMGIKLSMVDIHESSSPNLCCILKSTRLYRKALSNRTKTPGMMMEELNRYYDDRKGRLDAPPGVALPYNFVLEINTSLWTVMTTPTTPYFTPDELAAATLHELGHVDHFIRVSMRVNNRLVDASDIIDYVGKTHDKDYILKLINFIATSPYIDKSWMPIIKAVDTYFRSTNSFSDPAYYEALSCLTTVMAAESSSHNLLNFRELCFHRINDKVDTRMLVVDSERTADEYSSRQGAYKDLISMLAKLNQLSTTKSDLVFRQYLWYTPALVLGLLVQFGAIFDISSEDISNGYDPLMRRLELINETAKHAFHDASLSDSAKADIKAQITLSQDYIDQYSSAAHTKIRASIKAWKDGVSTFGRIMKSPIQNRLSQDYERLQNANRSLSRNSLYYLANK